ncbi:glucose-fructose oxidoreductase domain-containing protein 1-like [Haliotis asinina]|uniref:glucose-fructose oxidoreductase domain-containing protein 1-like n=1 Tax=Haliotis asinina TaxID=109174 RepID=UPI003531FF41
MRKMLPGVGVFGTTAVIKCVVPILKTCGFNVVALWGCTVEEADTLAKELGIPHSTNKVDEVLLDKDVDLVVISCSPHLQAPIVVKALRIGKHVLCGSPFGPSEREALHMVNAARYYPRLMSLMCHGLRFLPIVSKMKSYIEEGYVGDVTICEVKVHYGAYPREKFDWMCDELMGGGVLNAMGSNIIDIVTFLTSQKALRVHGMLKTYTKQTEKIKGIREITSDDFCTFQMEMEKGASTTVTVNSHMPGQFTQEIIVIGTKGRLVARGADLFGQKHDKLKEDLLHFDHGNIKEDKKFGISDQARKEIPIPHLKGMIRMIEGVKDAFGREEERQSWCTEPLQLAATFEDSFYVQTVVDAVRRSSKQKEWVKVVFMTEDPEPNPYLSAAMRRSTFSLQ